MARQLRVEFDGAIYHVTCRMLGDRRSALFRDDRDRGRLIERLAERVEQYGVRLYLYALMTNHFHLVFETPEANCSKFMHSLLTAYTVYYNLRHSRHGHLFDGRFKAKLVEGDEYLQALSRYVHLNPVSVGGIKNMSQAERIKSLREYRWSSYRSYIGSVKEQEFVSYGPVLAEMATTTKTSVALRRRRYREYVESGLAKDDEDFRLVLNGSKRSIGGEGFRVWVDKLYQELLEKHARPEDVSFRHTMTPLDPDDVLRVLAEVFSVDIGAFRQRRRNSPLRAIAATYLMKYAGLSQREVATRLSAGSGSAISKQMSRQGQNLKEDKAMQRKLHRCEKVLEQLRGDAKS